MELQRPNRILFSVVSATLDPISVARQNSRLSHSFVDRKSKEKKQKLKNKMSDLNFAPANVQPSVAVEIQPPVQVPPQPGPPAVAAVAGQLAGGQGQPPAPALMLPPAPPGLPVLPPLSFAPDPGTITNEIMALTYNQSPTQFVAEVNAMAQLFAGQPNFEDIAQSILNSTKMLCFLTVFRDGTVTVVHSIGKYSSGLGLRTTAHNRCLALVGEKVNGQLPPIVMMPVGGLQPWITLAACGVPTNESLAASIGATGNFAGSTVTQGVGTGVWANVAQLVYMPLAWVPYFLNRMTPWDAHRRVAQLTASLPAANRHAAGYLQEWTQVMCSRGVAPDESRLSARWQPAPTDRDAQEWLQKRLQNLVRTPAIVIQPATGPVGVALDPMLAFNSAMETVKALKPTSDSKTYSVSELQRLRASMSLTVLEMDTCMPPLHVELLSEGRTTRNTAAALARHLKPDETSDNPCQIYISPELVKDVKDCQYGLGLDTSYETCHRGLSVFAVPHMSLKHQQEKQIQQQRFDRASSTTITDVMEIESKPSQAPKDYYGLLQRLSGYLMLTKAIVGIHSLHVLEVHEIQRTLRQQPDIFGSLQPREILHILWAIFLDSRRFFSRSVRDGDPLPQSSLQYLKIFLTMGQVSTNTQGVPEAEFGIAQRPPAAVPSWCESPGTMFPAAARGPVTKATGRNPEYSPQFCQALKPLVDKYPLTTMNEIMASVHPMLKYELVRPGKRGECINFTILGGCYNAKCTYRHLPAHATEKRTTEILDSLAPCISAYMGKADRKKRPRSRDLPS